MASRWRQVSRTRLELGASANMPIATLPFRRTSTSYLGYTVPRLDEFGIADATHRIRCCKIQRRNIPQEILRKFLFRPESTSTREPGSVSMSKIWDSLRDVEQQEDKHDFNQRLRDHRERIPDRRSTERVWAYAPVLIYGYAAADDPFHEGTEALHVNAGGGLITLNTAVNPGQTLLLINKVNLKEQKCSVVRQDSAYLKRAAIVIAFPRPVPDFWDTTC